VPSQNGFLVGPPQRQSATVARSARTRSDVTVLGAVCSITHLLKGGGHSLQAVYTAFQQYVKY
jgi:hypothetical protein